MLNRDKSTAGVSKWSHKLNEYCLGKVKYSKGGDKILKFDY